jgi:hypothetical protein
MSPMTKERYVPQIFCAITFRTNTAAHDIIRDGPDRHYLVEQLTQARAIVPPLKTQDSPIWLIAILIRYFWSLEGLNTNLVYPNG